MCFMGSTPEHFVGYSNQKELKHKLCYPRALGSAQTCACIDQRSMVSDYHDGVTRRGAVYRLWLSISVNLMV
jgi:hypothetical protein